MAKLKLTKKLIDSLSVTDNKHGVKYYDKELANFGIIVFPNGRKTFFITYGTKGQRKQMALGPYGVLTVDEARKRARQELAKVLDGRDPKQERMQADQVTAFDEWVSEYLQQVKLRKKNPREDVRYLGWAVKEWGNQPLEELKVNDIERYYRKLVNTGKKTTANRWLASVRACLQDAWRRDLIPSNPAMKIQSMTEPEPRTKTLSDSEYDRLIEALETIPDIHARAAFHLLLETGARLSEVLHAKWEHIDFVNGLWRVPSTKSGKPQTIPLLPDVLTMLQELPRDSVYVIAGKIKDRPRNDLKRPWKSLLDAAGIEGVTIHDLRRTFGLQVSRTSGLHVASKLLRHSDIRVTERHYAPLDIEEQRRALERRKGKLS